MNSGEPAIVRVLLVEDERLIRLVLVELLTDAGLRVTAAGTGDDAAALIDGPDGFDLVLTDMQMPGGLDGTAVARHARRRHPGICVIYMTGRPEVLRGVGALGPRDAVLPKPFAPSELLPVIRRLLAAAA